MKAKLVGLLAAATMTGGALWAAPLDVKRVPEKAEGVVHLDAEALWKSDAGKFLKTEMAGAEPVKMLEKLRRESGLDPLQDVAGVTLVGLPQNGGKAWEDGAVLLELTQANPDLINKVQSMSPGGEAEYNGHDLYEVIRGNQKGPATWACFYKPELLVASQRQELLKSVLDVLDGKQPALKSDSALAKDCAQAAGRILFSAGSGKDLKSLNLPGLNPGGRNGNGNGEDAPPPILQSVQRAMLQLWEEEGKLRLNLAVQADTAENATLIEQALGGLRAMGVIALSRKASQDPMPMKLLQAIQVGRDDRAVKLDFAWGSTELLTWAKQKNEESKTEARGRGQKMDCKNNLKQIGTAGKMFADDNQGKLPDSLADLAKSQLLDAGSAYHCPAAPGRPPATPEDMANPELCSYAYFGKGKTISGVGARDVIVVERTPHGKEFNVLFGDGHVESVKAASLDEVLAKCAAAATASPAPAVTRPAAVALPAPAAGPHPDAIEYNVVANDTLESIASLFGVKPGDLTRLNPGVKSSADLRPGMSLVVPYR